jgi:acetylornithine deacetylase/succinyl-diaminopimelate desuccinylase-like protein
VRRLIQLDPFLLVFRSQAVVVKPPAQLSRSATRGATGTVAGDACIVSDVAELTARLVEIESINPDLMSGGSGEAAVARYVAEWCERAGLEVAIEEAAPGRPNVIAVARGSGDGHSLILNAHMDTVGIAGMDEPFSGRRDGGRLHGRGAYDMKGSLAASMLATAEAARRGLRGDVILAAVADEEYASVGTSAFAASHRADGAIVTEPTEMRLAVAHKGFVGVEIVTEGRAAHGSRPDLGVDAIARMGPVLVGIEELDRELRADPRHRYLGSGSIHASIIEGGQEFSSYPARCVLQAERRTIPGETVAAVEAELRDLLDGAASGDAALSADLRIVVAREPFEVDEREPIVELTRRHAAAVLGREPETIGVPFWADSALLAAAGTPTVLFGPSGEGAHAEIEWVDIGALERCVEIYLAVAAEFCGPGSD